MARYALRFGDDPETEIVDLGEFYALNDLDPADVNAIGALEVGDSYLMGGGAAVAVAVRRVA